MKPNLFSFDGKDYTDNCNSSTSTNSSNNDNSDSSGNSRRTSVGSFNNETSKDNSAITFRSKLFKFLKKRSSLYATLIVNNNTNDNTRIDEGFQQQHIEQQKRRQSLALSRLSNSSLTDSSVKEDNKSVKVIDPIQQLPIELFCLILSYCDKPTIVQATRVSTYWYSLCTDNYLWQQLYLNHFGTIYKGQYLSASPIAITTNTATSTTIAETNNRNIINYQRLYRTKMELLQRWNNNTTSHLKDFYTSSSTPSHYLYYYRQQQNYENDYRIRSVVGHKDSIYCVQFDRRKIVTGSRDKTIKFWHHDNPSHCYRTLCGHEASVLCLQYNDTILVSGSSDHTVIVWSMKSFEILYRLSGHLSGVLDVCFEDASDNDNPLIASCSKDTTIKIWKDQRLVRSLCGHRGPVNAIQFKGTRLVSASGDTTIKLWDMTTGKCLRDFEGHTHGLACIQFDGKKIVSGGNDNKIKVWDADTGDCIFTCTGHTGLVRSLFFDQDKIVSGSYDQSIRIWSIKTGECIRIFNRCHTSWVFDVMFDETQIISTSQDQKIVIIDFAHDLDTTHIVKV